MPQDSPSGPVGSASTRALTRSAARPAVPRGADRAADRVVIAAHELALVAATALPALRRSLVVAAVAYAAERALSATVGGALGRLLGPIERAAPAITRTEITEWVVIERIRRR